MIDVAQRALGGDFHRRLGLVDAEQILPGVADLPEHRAIGLDDVLVAGQHLAFAARGRIARRRVGRAELDLVDLGDFGKQRRFDRVGPVEVQAGARRVDPFAEAQHDALFVGLYAVDRGREPAEDDDQRNQDPPALSKARRSEDRARLWRSIPPTPIG